MGNINKVYLALGDSMSLDIYPEEDALAQFGRRIPRVGSASLLYENCQDLWPEFEHQDIITRFPWSGFENRASDGAVIKTVLESQLPGDPRRDVWLCTLTIGGNDMLEMVWDGIVRPEEGLLVVQDKYTDLVATVQQYLPEARLVLSTIYDPSDGTGKLPGMTEAFPVHLVQRLNDHIRNVASTTKGTFLADVYAHFQGHGVGLAENDWWYLPDNPIEPRARGASEIRRTWWQTISALPE